jgi:hypothetical protein
MVYSARKTTMVFFHLDGATTVFRSDRGSHITRDG